MRGLVLRLGGSYDALEVRVEGDAVVARAGAGGDAAATGGAGGVARSRSASIGLAGIPATVGGALRMNAGTDREIGEFVREVRVQSAARPEPAPVVGGVLVPAHDARAGCARGRRDLGLRARRPGGGARAHAGAARAAQGDPARGGPQRGLVFPQPAGRPGRAADRGRRGQGLARGRGGSLPLHANFIVNVAMRRRSTSARCSPACTARSTTRSASTCTSKSTSSESS